MKLTILGQNEKEGKKNYLILRANLIRFFYKSNALYYMNPLCKSS
jgi:hypothetical protein